MPYHRQIDRWFAVWEAVNPDEWFPPEHVGDLNASLLPFRTSKDASGEKFYNSMDVKECDRFGYTYDDLSGKPPDQIRKDFREKYLWSFREHEADPIGEPPKEMQPFDLSKAQVYQYGAVGRPAFLKDGMLGVTLPIKESLVQAAENYAEALQAPSSITDAGEPKPDKAVDWYVDDVVER